MLTTYENKSARIRCPACLIDIPAPHQCPLCKMRREGMQALQERIERERLKYVKKGDPT
jgi:primosomal protein N'